jgi:hypothetical protein
MTFLGIYVLYPELVHSVHFFPFMMILIGLNVVYSFSYKRYSNHIRPLYFLFWPSLSPLLVSVFPLAWPVFHSYPSLFRYLLIVQWSFAMVYLLTHLLFFFFW